MRWSVTGSFLRAASYATYDGITWFLLRTCQFRQENADSLFDQFMSTYDVVQSSQDSARSAGGVVLVSACDLDL
jgi:hypothetical protein